MLRKYQSYAIELLYQWFRDNPSGNPILELPTGSGKSWIVAQLCRDALDNWPETRVLMLTHQKELIEQNAEKLRLVWPDAPMGIYSAGLKQRDIDAITFAGIQSVRDRADDLGHIDLVVIDECHLINNARQGGYRKLLGALAEINPALRVIGLTATPYRLGQGYLTEGKDALFDDILRPTTIEGLVHDGFLAPLRSKATELKLDVTGVKKTAGEYNAKELEARVNTDLNNYEAVREILKIADATGRKSVIVFCAGVEHAHSVADMFNELGQRVGTIVGTTPPETRARIIELFRSGELRFVTNANVLTTGFDAPGVDIVALLRPTMSPTLYVQMVGRGMRVAEGKEDCLVLDFAGNVANHGPITAVEPNRKGGGGKPTKTCPECDEIMGAASKTCPHCGYEYPEKEREEKDPNWALGDEDIMGAGRKQRKLRGWMWRRHISKASGKEMVKVSYYGENLSDQAVTEYLPVLHDGYARDKAWSLLTQIAERSGAYLGAIHDLDDLCVEMNGSKPPQRIEFVKSGKFFEVKRRIWDADLEELAVAS
jgi:DNA repair protein RadD